MTTALQEIEARLAAQNAELAALEELAMSLPANAVIPDTFLAELDEATELAPTCSPAAHPLQFLRV